MAKPNHLPPVIPENRLVTMPIKELWNDTQRIALMDIRDALVEIVKLLQEYLNKSK